MVNIDLRLGDCLDIMKTIPDKSIDAVITDPPYGLEIDYGDTYNDTRENLVQTIAAFFPEAQRIARRVVISSGISPMFLYPSPDWVVACTWNTTGNHGKYGFNQWFPLLCYGKDLAGFGSINGTLKSDVLSVSGGAAVGFMRDPIEKQHPCPKPLNLVVKMVSRFTTEGDTILDPFAGSGTTGVACVKLNRNFIGIEINPQYFEIARRRIEAAQAQLALPLTA